MLTLSMMWAFWICGSLERCSQGHAEWKQVIKLSPPKSSLHSGIDPLCVTLLKLMGLWCLSPFPSCTHSLYPALPSALGFSANMLPEDNLMLVLAAINLPCKTIFLERCCSYLCGEAAISPVQIFSSTQRSSPAGLSWGHSCPLTQLCSAHANFRSRKLNCRILSLFLTYFLHKLQVNWTQGINLEPGVRLGLLQWWIFSEHQETTLAPPCRQFLQLLGFLQYLFHLQLCCFILATPYVISIFFWHPPSFSSENNLQSLLLPRATFYRQLHPTETLWHPYHEEMVVQGENPGCSAVGVARIEHPQSLQRS